MKTLISIENWDRKACYQFFSKFDEPFFGVTVKVDCTKAYQDAKQKGITFFLYYLYRALKAANEIENFRYRIIDNRVYLLDKANASSTIGRPNMTFGFTYMEYETDEQLFYKNASEEIQRIQKTTDFLPAVSSENIIYFSAVPWLDFTAISHARSFSFPDSSPKISFGKMTENNGIKTMPVSIHAHHGLMDGYHTGLFVDRFQDLMSEI